MQTKIQHHRLKPRQSPNPDTWLGRHLAAMECITERFSKLANAHPGLIIAWVIGIGGKDAGVNPPTFTPTEHIEVAQALEKAKAKEFCVYAMDISVQSIAMAQEQLNSNTVKAARKGHPSIPKTAQGVDFSVPKNVAEKITLLGPGDVGDIFLTEPRKRPDLITIFNVARSYHRRHQARLARKLADALKEQGILFTNATDNQTVFVKTLEKILGGPADLGPTHDEGKEGRMVAFEKKARS